MDKFAGIGLTNIVLIWLVMMLLNVMAKVIAIKYQDNLGTLSDIIFIGA